ncbi:MAG TPA: hypothetical protein VM818_05665 [Vicinamibacterales bacterium]|nr:hypothetical protein [Vicinamibacterales bacterium]
MTRCRFVLIILATWALGPTHVAHAQLAASTSLPPLEAPRDDTSALDGLGGSGPAETPASASAPTQGSSGGTDYRGAIGDSIRLLLIQHAVRVSTQDKTRRALTGPFFSDYRRSVAMPLQWGDTDSGMTNYVLHPGQGAASGFIWLQNSAGGEMPFALTADYMSSRLWATLWALGYSLQFEIGPFSEASIGNVGMRRETTGWVDHVITPAGGLAIMMFEDMLDRYVVRKLEDRTDSPVLRAMMRMFLTPSRATANVSGMRAPWYRAGRPVG